MDLAQTEVQGGAVGERNPLARQQRLHSGDQRIAGLEPAQLCLAEQDPRRIGEGLGRRLHRLTRLGLPSELHEERPAVGDGVHLRRTGKAGGAFIGRQRRFELAHGLKHLADRVVRLRGLRRGERRALGPIHRLVEPVEILQGQRFRGERASMRRREGEQRVERAQGVGGAMTRGLHAGEIDIGVDEPRIEFDRA